MGRRFGDVLGDRVDRSGGVGDFDALLCLLHHAAP